VNATLRDLTAVNATFTDAKAVKVAFTAWGQEVPPTRRITFARMPDTTSQKSAAMP
jgi:hypothetical protein